jgi:hypothetical protein
MCSCTSNTVSVLASLLLEHNDESSGMRFSS